METEDEILQQGIEALEEVGLQTTKWIPANKPWADYIMHLNGAGHDHQYWVEVKKNLNNAILGQWAMRLKEEPHDNLVLLTRYINSRLGEKLREMKISYFDTAGNAYFNKPPLYIYSTGKKPKENRPKSNALFRPAGIKLLLHLLSQPGLERNDYRDLTEITGVPKTTVGELMRDLENLRFLIRRGKNDRRLTNKPELLRRWVEAYSENYRPKLLRGRFAAPQGKRNWWQQINIEQFHACWGGEIGAKYLVGHLKPEAVTIYADSLLPILQAKNGLRRDPQGNIEILKPFWKGQTGDTAPPLVVYADLISTADERNLETAQMIYDKYLARLIDNAAEYVTRMWMPLTSARFFFDQFGDGATLRRA